MEIKTISILGCGWFGLSFAKALLNEKYKVKGSTTSAEKLNELIALGMDGYLINLNEDDVLPNDFFEADVLFVCVPPRAKTAEVSSYPSKMEKVARAATKVPEIVFISSTGIFEDGNFEVDETTEPKPDTDSGRALLATEQLFSNNAQFSATIIRFAGLIGPGRNLAKFFAGKTAIANGRAPINLITLQDCIGLCLQLLKTKKFGGIYHAVTPQHPSRNEFYTRLCEVSHMEKPSFKDELLAWKQINSLHVPSQLSYTFKVQNWFDWMDAKLGGRL